MMTKTTRHGEEALPNTVPFNVLLNVFVLSDSTHMQAKRNTMIVVLKS